MHWRITTTKWIGSLSLAQARMIKNFKEQVEGFAQRGNSGIVEIKNYIKAEFMLYVGSRGLWRGSSMECIIFCSHEVFRNCLNSRPYCYGHSAASAK